MTSTRHDRKLSFGWAAGLSAAALSLAIAPATRADPTPPVAKSTTTLFQNVRVFDGKHATLSAPSNVLVSGNVITQISTGPIDAGAGARVIAGGGRTLMPGLIDAHWHCILAALPMAVAMTADIGYIHLLAAQEAERTVLRGFTTVACPRTRGQSASAAVTESWSRPSGARTPASASRSFVTCLFSIASAAM